MSAYPNGLLWRDLANEKIASSTIEELRVVLDEGQAVHGTRWTWLRRAVKVELRKRGVAV